MPTDSKEPTSTSRSTYAAAGVDIDAANSAVDQMKAHIATTRLPGVLSSAAGSFGGMFSLGGAMQGMREPVLVSSIDGVGTKLKLAFLTGRHAEVAGDLVSHCVNDILVQGARALFFLDYFGTGKLTPSVAVDVVAGLSESCRAAGCVLIGGETAEMPGMYTEGEYDLAGCIVGIVDRDKIVTGERVAEGDVVIGLASEGLHTNGYSLARHVLLETAKVDLKAIIPNSETTYGDALLARHRCYAPSVLPLLSDAKVHGMAHITGGGLLENIPRILPEDLSVAIDRSAWRPQAIFEAIQKLGPIADEEMFRVFNMGIGYVLIVGPDDVNEIVAQLRENGETTYRIGTVQAGSGVTFSVAPHF